MQSSITKRTLAAFFWAFSGSAAQSLLRVLVLVVLARLLNPAEFGLVGAAAVVISFADLFSQLGVSPAIVQRPKLTDTHVAVGFTISVVLSLATGLLVVALSPLLAIAFRMPALTPIVAALALTFPIRGLSVVAEAILQRHMRFRAITGATIASFVLGYAPVAIILAALHWGVWSLVLSQLVQTAFLTIGLFYFARHDIKFSLNVAVVKEIAHFGLGVSIARIGNYIAVNADNFIVGRYLGASALGFYSRAYTFLMQPTNLIGTVVDRVLFPAMVSVQDNDEKLARGYSRCLSLVALITLPLSAFLVVLGPQIIHVLLGPNWSEAIAPFQILAMSLVGRVGYKMSDTLTRAKGAVYRGAWRQWIYAVEIVTFASIGSFWGVTGVAIGVTAAILLQYIVMLQFGRQFVAVSWAAIGWFHCKYLLIALFLAGILYAEKRLALNFTGSDVLIILGGCLASVATLWLLWLTAPGLFGDEGQWIAALVKSRSSAKSE